MQRFGQSGDIGELLRAPPDRRRVGDRRRPGPARLVHDVLVAGGGIVGLATARALALRGMSVVVLEREARLGQHQTTHNSGVDPRRHLLRARVAEGAAVRGGRGRAVRVLRRARDRRRCAAASSWSRCAPTTCRGSTSSSAVRAPTACRASSGSGRTRSRASSRTPAACPRCTRRTRGWSTSARSPPPTRRTSRRTAARSAATRPSPRWSSAKTTSRPSATDVRARRAVACAGAWSDRLALASGARPDVRIVPFRGSYLTLTEPALVRGQIYPVPDPALPFLGVHLSRTVAGEVLIGPTALLVPRRAPLRWPGTWRVMRRWWRTGLTEIAHAASRRLLLREARGFVPEIAGVAPGPARLPRAGGGARRRPRGRLPARPHRPRRARAQRAVTRRHGLAGDRRDDRRRGHPPLICAKRSFICRSSAGDRSG